MNAMSNPDWKQHTPRKRLGFAWKVSIWVGVGSMLYDISFFAAIPGMRVIGVLLAPFLGLISALICRVSVAVVYKAIVYSWLV